MIYIFVAFLAWISFFSEAAQEHYAIYTKAFLMVMFLCVIFKPSLQSFRKKRTARFLLDQYGISLLVFLTLLLGGLISATDRRLAIHAYLNISMSLFLLFFITRALFKSERDLKTFAVAICIFSAIIVIFGLIELILNKNFIYEYIITDNPYYTRYIGERPMSTQFNPSVLASFLLGCLPFGLLLTEEKDLLYKILGRTSLVFNIAIIILCNSRGVVLGTIALFLFYLWKKKGPRAASLFLISILLLVSVCSLPGAKRFRRFGFDRLIVGSYDSIFSEYRFRRLSMAFRMVKDHPFVGVGLNNFRERFDDYNVYDENPILHEFKIPDNMYLSILAESGIVGFCGFFIFIFPLLKKGMRGSRRGSDPRHKEVLLVSMSGMVGYLVNMGGYELFYWHNPFALFCILCGMVAAYSNN